MQISSSERQVILSNSESRSTSRTYLVGIYLAAFAFCAGVYWAVGYFAQSDHLPPGGVSEFVTAMTMGWMWASREKVAPPSRDAWIISLWCASVTIALSAIVGAVLVVIDDALMHYLESIGVVSMLLLAALGIVLELLIIRLGVWSGTRAAIKSLRKQV